MRTAPFLSSFALKLKCAFISLCLAAMSINSSALFAQGFDDDIDAPRVSQPLEEGGVVGQPQSVIVTITDDSAIEYATLYYRFGEAGDFIADSMKQSQENSFEAIALPNDSTATSFYYYIKAADSAGNITFSGYKFSPKMWTLTPASKSQASAELQSNAIESTTVTAEQSINQAAEPKPVANVKSGNRTLYTVLGILAAAVVVGAVASGGDGGAEECQVAGCDVKFVGTALQ